MQHLSFVTVVIVGILMSGCALAGEVAPEKAKLPKEIDILIWGASGLTGVSKMMPEMAKDIGHTVHVHVLSRSFNRYPMAIRAARGQTRARWR